MTLLPLFKSHHSIGKSILTLEKREENPDPTAPPGPDSIVDLAINNGLKHVFLVEDSFGGGLEAYQNLKSAGIKLTFGLRLSFCSDITDKSEESKASECKFVIFAKNYAGYQKLIKLYWAACKDGFYYHPRLDYATLKGLWAETDLRLVVPFYDSFIHSNHCSFNTCVPDFSFTNPVFFLEKNGLPIDKVLREKLFEYTKDKYSVLPAKSIYYAKREDFEAYQAFRCIDNRSTMEEPEMSGMSSDEFCLESWKEQNE